MPSRPSSRLVLLAFASPLLFVHTPARAAVDELSFAFADLETALAPWEAGRTRLMIWLQADSCVRQAARGKGKGAWQGELGLELEVNAAGKATKVIVSGSTRTMKKAATCLQRALRSRIHFLEQPEGFTWKSKLRAGEAPEGVSVNLFRIDTEYVSDRSIFESVFVTQIERAACLASALEPGMSVAINADLEMTPGKPTIAKVELSTHAPAAVVSCLQPQLAAIVPPLTGVPSKVHIFFHLLQPAPDPLADDVDVLQMAPTGSEP